MQLASNRNRQKADPKQVAIAILVLVACLLFPVYYTFWYVDTGFALNSRWAVIDVTYCLDHPTLCEGEEAAIHVGDQVIRIGEYTFEDFESDRELEAFAKVESGDLLELVLIRDGIEYTIQWEIPPQDINVRIESLIVPILIILPFWFAGSVILIFMRPRSEQWRLLVLMNYLTAFWLAAGMFSNYRVLSSSILLHAASWLMLPVYLHLHLIVPSSLYRSRLKNVLVAIYAISLFMAVLELAQIPQQYTYAVSVFFAAFGSIGILVYRLVSKRTSSSDRIAARLMLVGIVLAFGPGIVTWIIPTILDIRTPSTFTTSVALLALPLLPLFYTYTVFKRRLGVLEVRINRLMAVYALFIVYLIALTLLLLVRESLPALRDPIYTFYLIIFVAVLLAINPLQDQFKKRVNKLAYGIEFDPDDLYRVYASKIPAAVDRDSLVHLLGQEIVPPLGIRESVLIIQEGSEYIPIYNHGLSMEQLSLSKTDLLALRSKSAIYIPPTENEGEDLGSKFDWIRLSLILERRSESIGYWLFGKRDPDDFYAQKDIKLLSNLAKQVAIAIENMRFLEKVQSELAERIRTEEALKSYADRLELIHEIDQAVIEVNSPQEIAQAALDRLQKLIPFTRGSVLFYEPAAGEAEVLAVYGRSPIGLGAESRIPLEIYTTRDTLAEGVIWKVDDINQLPEDSALTQLIQVDGIRAVLSAPLTASGELVGSLNLGSYEPACFDLVHQEIASEVANSLAIAIHSARLLETVTGHRQELQRLSNRLVTIQEEERKQISYELHDEIGQVLTAITYNLAAIRRDIPEEVVYLRAEARLSDTEELVRQVMERTRSMSLRLRPSMLQDLGLVPTLRWYINQYGIRMDTEVEFTADSIDPELPETIATMLYRFIQEGLTNAARYSGANRIAVTLVHDDGCIRAIVEDDGIGFEPDGAIGIQSPNTGTGLLGIRERVSSLGGRLDIETTLGEGTRLIAEVPLGESDEKN